MTPLVHPSTRPGQMTSVMRAVRPTGSRALRVALVRGGKILDERVLPLGEHLTVGPTERSLFVVAGLGASVRLLEWSRAGYRLHLGAGMRGRVAIGGEVTEVSGQRAFAPLALDDEARGRIAVGDAVVLFHFVEPAVAVARPQLPLAVRQGPFDGFDWPTTCVAAFSFLLHFGAVGALYTDFADTEIQDDGARVAQMVELVRPLPQVPIDVPPAPADGPAVGGTTRQPGPVTARSGGRSEPGGARPSGGHSGDRSPSDTRAAEIARLLSEEGNRMVAVIGGASGHATDTVTAQGGIPTTLIDDLARDGSGARTTGNPFLNLPASVGPVRPGGGRPGMIAGADGKADDRANDSGKVTAPKSPIGITSVAPPDIAVGKLPDAGRVVAGLRGQLRSCYKHALDEDPTTRGTVRVTAKIGPNGEVSSVQMANGVLSTTMITCVSRVVRGAQFSPPESGGAMVAIPMTFMPQ